MPNWCTNYVKITGHVETLDKIQNVISEQRQNKSPYGLLEFLEPIGEWDYHKAIEKWDTKWDVDIDYMIRDHEYDDEPSLRLKFVSAWSPPILAYKQGEKNHDIEIDAFFLEEGVGFMGSYSDGEENFYAYEGMNAYLNHKFYFDEGEDTL